MLNLTQQERQVILFLATVTLVGLGINFAVKTNSRIGNALQADNYITKIDINRASLEDLVGTSYISNKLAQKIISYRSSHGPFRSIEDLKEIKGIGDYRYEKLKDLFFIQ